MSALCPDLENVINLALNKEYQAMYMYEALELIFTKKGLGGFAKYFAAQAAEERIHANLIKQYMLMRNTTPTLLPINVPNVNSFMKPLEALSEALEQEIAICSHAKTVLEIARNNNDAHAEAFFTDTIMEEQYKSIAELSKRVTILSSMAPYFYIVWAYDCKLAAEY